MFFDWPPWTRSTVLAYTLRQCWEKRHGFEMASYNDFSERSQAISAMVNLSSPYVAMVGQHMHLPKEELELLQHACDYRYYVTTTRRVEERVFYSYKSDLLGSKYIADVDADMTNDTVNWVKSMVLGGKTSKIVSKLERYPFDNHTLGPDYVIRSWYYSSDLQDFLDGFGCTDLLPEPSLDISAHFEEDAISIEDVYDSSSFIVFKNRTGNVPTTLEEEDEQDKAEAEAEASSEPSRKLGDSFVAETAQDIVLAGLLAKGIDSGEIVYRKLREYAFTHNDRGLQKIKEVLALRYQKVPDVPIDEEAIALEKFAVLGDEDDADVDSETSTE